MAEETKVIEVTQDNLCESPRWGIKNREHEGHTGKPKTLLLRTQSLPSSIMASYWLTTRLVDRDSEI
jgi:hypothetical protein